MLFFFFFFFQAEDGIRDKLVTGVQTCALPISRDRRARRLTVGGQLGVLREVVLGRLRRAELVGAPVHRRHLLPVAVRRGRRQRPFETVVLPRVLRRPFSLLEAPPEVHEEDQLGREQQKRADRDEHPNRL